MIGSVASALRPVLAGLAIAALAQGGPAAAEAYWMGLRGDKWNDGIKNGVSNWYSEPSLAGTAQKVPDDTAIFANGALNSSIVIWEDAEIQRIRFEALAPVFTLSVDPTVTFEITKFGVANQSNNTHFFAVAANGKVLFRGKSRIVGAGGGVRSLNFQNAGTLMFSDKAKGGDAIVNNTDGSLLFNGKASAEGMAITNQKGVVAFGEESTGGGARIINQEGVVAFNLKESGKFTIGSLLNSDTMGFDGDASVSETFVQSASGKLVIACSKTVPTIKINGTAKLDGELLLTVQKKTKAGKYTLIKAGTIEGKFKKLKVEDGDLKGSLAYSEKAVVLTLVPK